MSANAKTECGACGKVRTIIGGRYCGACHRAAAVLETGSWRRTRDTEIELEARNEMNEVNKGWTEEFDRV
jgi:hypothetical protein